MVRVLARRRLMQPAPTLSKNSGPSKTKRRFCNPTTSHSSHGAPCRSHYTRAGPPKVTGRPPTLERQEYKGEHETTKAIVVIVVAAVLPYTVKLAMLPDVQSWRGYNWTYNPQTCTYDQLRPFASGLNGINGGLCVLAVPCAGALRTSCPWLRDTLTNTFGCSARGSGAVRTSRSWLREALLNLFRGLCAGCSRLRDVPRKLFMVSARSGQVVLASARSEQPVRGKAVHGFGAL